MATQIQTATGVVRVPTATWHVDETRDAHLRSEDFLDVDDLETAHGQVAAGYIDPTISEDTKLIAARSHRPAPRSPSRSPRPRKTAPRLTRELQISRGRARRPRSPSTWSATQLTAQMTTTVPT